MKKQGMNKEDAPGPGSVDSGYPSSLANPGSVYQQDLFSPATPYSPAQKPGQTPSKTPKASVCCQELNGPKTPFSPAQKIQASPQKPKTSAQNQLEKLPPVLKPKPNAQDPSADAQGQIVDRAELDATWADLDAIMLRDLLKSSPFKVNGRWVLRPAPPKERKTYAEQGP